MKRAPFISSVALALGAVWTSPAFAEPPQLPAAPEEPLPTLTLENRTTTPPPSAASMRTEADHPAREGRPRYDLIRINGGFRIGYVPSRAFDAFASNDVLPQVSIDGTYPLFTRGKLVLGAGVGWDFGGRKDKIRGFSSHLLAHRLYVPLEARWHFTPWLAGFGKLSPGAVAALASVEDPASSTELSGTAWAFSADASIGASILMGPHTNMEKRVPRFWITPEIGYAYTTNASLHLNPGRDEKDLLGSDENANLRSLALSGVFWRLSVGATF